MIGKNNPFNIRAGRSSWIGQTGVFRGFCDFCDVSFAVRAVLYLFLKSYKKYGCLTLSECIHRYCPFGDGANNPDKYVSSICKRSYGSLTPDTIISSCSDLQLFYILQSMAFIECNFLLSDYVFIKGLNKFKNG